MGRNRKKGDGEDGRKIEWKLSKVEYKDFSDFPYITLIFR